MNSLAKAPIFALSALVLACADPASAQPARDSGSREQATHADDSDARPASPDATTSDPEADPDDESDPDAEREAGGRAEDLAPVQRLDRAEEAFREGDFDKIPPLLEPILGENPALDSRDSRVRARELLGVGLYFQAQQATDPERRDTSMDAARRQFLELLRERPDYELDSLIFPASVVDLFESVRRKHSEELAKIRQKKRRQSQTASNEPGSSSTTLYIERQVKDRLYIFNFFPFGIGQFQNNQPVKGALFAGGQIAGLAIHAVGFFQIESLRQPSGKFKQSDLQSATRWRNTQAGALIGAGALFAFSVLDALLNYQPQEVDIRTLDEPPPELSSRHSPAGKPPRVDIGFGTVGVRW